MFVVALFIYRHIYEYMCMYIYAHMYVTIILEKDVMNLRRSLGTQKDLDDKRG